MTDPIKALAPTTAAPTKSATTRTAPSRPLAPKQALAEGLELTRQQGRDDLVQRLEQAQARVDDPETRVLVVGEFKQGKSQLINALVSAPVCPVDDDIATTVPTLVRYGDEADAVVLRPGSHGEMERMPIALDALVDFVSESGNPDNHRGLAAAEVSLPRAVLEGGLAVVDSPGLGGFSSTHSLTTLTALPTADAVLLVSDASQEYTDPEIQFLRQALRICPNVACVVSKIDLYPDWREIADRNRAHLDQIDRDIPLFAVSADLRSLASVTGDDELHQESGYAALVSYLRSDVLAQCERLQARSVSRDVVSVTDHLGMALRSELNAILDPQGTPERIAALEATKARVDELRRRSSRWQTTLNDGVSDLIADMEHDLRDRMRTIQRDAEHAIDETDPGPMWDELVEWMSGRVSAAVSDTFVWTDERSRWLSEQVADHFARDGADVPDLRVDDATDPLDPVQSVPSLDPGRIGVFQKVLIGMRGSYGGVLMVGLITGILGMSLINPFSIGAGVLIGTKVYRDEMANRLKRRQAEAKVLVRGHLDDVVFQVGKQLKDRLRLVQRSTRDHFTELADEHHKSLAESVLAAQNAVTTFTAERDDRIAELRAALSRLTKLRSDAVALAPRRAARAAA